MRCEHCVLSGFCRGQPWLYYKYISTSAASGAYRYTDIQTNRQKRQNRQNIQTDIHKYISVSGHISCHIKCIWLYNSLKMRFFAFWQNPEKEHDAVHIALHFGFIKLKHYRFCQSLSQRAEQFENKGHWSVCVMWGLDPNPSKHELNCTISTDLYVSNIFSDARATSGSKEK